MLNILLNLALFTVKFIGGKLSNSVSVTSDAFNNLTDAVTTMFAWLGLKVSSFGAGEKHPNGHGRFEWVIALLAGSSVILVGWELLRDSISAIKDPGDTIFSVFTLIVLAISIGVKFFMYLDNNKKSKENNSSALKAVSVDCLSDAASTSVVLISLLINALFHVNIDGWCGVLVSLFIMYNGFSSFFETINRIMGHSAAKEQLDEMRSFVMENGDFKDILDLQIEDYGYGRYRVSMTVIGGDNVDAQRLLSDAAQSKYQIFERYGYHAQISVEKNCSENSDIRAYVEQKLSTIDPPIQILSFRENIARDYHLILLDLGIELLGKHKMEDVEAEVLKSFSQAPEGYKILTQLRLTSRDRQGYRNRYLARKHADE